VNKTWSIILIVVACIVVLGGTYWYFGMQKPKTQGEPTPSALVVPTKTPPPVAKANAVVASSPKTEQSLPEQVVETKVKPAAEASPTEQAVTPNLPAETPKETKRLPAPIAPVITKDGGFALPSFGNTSEKAVTEKNALTSVLASEELPSKADVSNIPAIQEEKAINLGPVTEEPVVQKEIPVVASADSLEIQASEKPEAMKTELADEGVLPPSREAPVEAIPETKQEIVPVTVAATPPVVKILRSETTSAEKLATDDKPALEANLSVSFLDYNFPKDFSSTEKGFNVSVDVMSQKEMFGWGGTLEVGKDSTTDVVQISLLGKTAWRMGKDVVTFPLSISLGPTLFIDSTANTTGFGLKAKLGAGVTYAISESFRMFYTVGVGITYNFQDSTSFRFVLEPIRVGIGFSF